MSMSCIYLPFGIILCFLRAILPVSNTSSFLTSSLSSNFERTCNFCSVFLTSSFSIATKSGFSLFFFSKKKSRRKSLTSFLTISSSICSLIVDSSQAFCITSVISESFFINSEYPNLRALTSIRKSLSIPVRLGMIPLPCAISVHIATFRKLWYIFFTSYFISGSPDISPSILDSYRALLRLLFHSSYSLYFLQ